MDENTSESSSVYYQQKNPWIDDRSNGSLRSILLLAQTTGHIPKEHALEIDNTTRELYESSQSLRMIKLQREIKSKRNKLSQINLEAQQCLQDKDTKDITHLDILEERLSKIKELNSHLESIVEQKDLLTSRLQQPFVNDFIRIDASYQRHASEVVPQLVPTLSDLPIQLGNIEWASRMDLKDGQLDDLLTDIAGTQSSQQALYQYTTKLRQSMNLLIKSSGNAQLDS